MKNKSNVMKNSFTLIELIAAMGVFSILMLVMLSFFDGAQRAWSNCINRGQIYENARVAMDLITRDLQCAYYEVDKTPFWYKGYTSYSGASDEMYNQQMLAFVAVTSVPPSDNCNSKICEVKYQLYNYDASFGGLDPKKEGWLMRSATGDRREDPVGSGTYVDNVYSALNVSGKLNYYNNFTVSKDGAPTATTNVFTANSASSEDFQKVIPYVTKLEFISYYRSVTPATWLPPSVIEIAPDLVGDGASYPLPASTYKMTFPYSVRIEISLLDQVAWTKWKAMGGKRYVDSSGVLVDSGNATAEDFRVKNERIFIKTVILGERGQN
ncbi:MAG TPA: hypothetical protein DET40_14975 [Lentisphaeria bacterium]|nr:MAG: hypothetical protein A2X45_13300 [Lentisphaerae bacterium GWF2_50_93]HCE44841.1 hypothetical protein [Lentisphaeria bacterium]